MHLGKIILYEHAPTPQLGTSQILPPVPPCALPTPVIMSLSPYRDIIVTHTAKKTSTRQGEVTSVPNKLNGQSSAMGRMRRNTEAIKHEVKELGATRLRRRDGSFLGQACAAVSIADDEVVRCPRTRVAEPVVPPFLGVVCESGSLHSIAQQVPVRPLLCRDFLGICSRCGVE